MDTDDNSNGKVCLFCNQSFVIKYRLSAAKVAKIRYCSRQCSNSHRSETGVLRKIQNCEQCHTRIPPVLNKQGNQRRRRFCIECLESRKRTVAFATKGELFSSRANWQSARSSIQKHARAAYIASRLPMECFVCEYSHHVDIAHRVSVSEFSDDSTVGEINAIDNLIPLCPNHHWEYDNGFPLPRRDERDGD